MNKDKRMSLIRELEATRRSRIVAYLTSDRQGSAAKIGTDIFPFLYDVLSRMESQEHIDLFLYSTGGVTMAAWGLVNLLREFCKRFCVLIPFKAHSSATLISLGADEIIMSRMGQLSPVDPTITSPFNPLLPNQIAGTDPQFLPVSVEDVSSYFDLAKEVGVKDEKLLSEVFKTLSSDIRPLALGSVYRAKQQIKMLSEKLLNFHMGADEKKERDEIVSKLVRELYSHDYPIGRTEAKNQIGLKVVAPPEDLESKIVALFRCYSDLLQLNDPFNAEKFLGQESTKTGNFDAAYIESTEITYIFRVRKEVKRVKIQQQGGRYSSWHPRAYLRTGMDRRPGVTWEKGHRMNPMKVLTAKNTWSGTLGISSPSQLINGTLNQVANLGDDTTFPQGYPKRRLLIPTTKQLVIAASEVTTASTTPKQTRAARSKKARKSA